MKLRVLVPQRGLEFTLPASVSKPDFQNHLVAFKNSLTFFPHIY